MKKLTETVREVFHVLIVLIAINLFITPFIANKMPVPSEEYGYTVVLILIYLLLTPLSIFKIYKKWK